MIYFYKNFEYESKGILVIYDGVTQTILGSLVNTKFLCSLR